jgi:hypothetical protein
MGFLQKWFNYPPDRNTPFILDKHGEKFWILFEDEEAFHVWYKDAPVGQVKLIWQENNSVLLADIEIFCKLKYKQKFQHRDLGKAMLQKTIELVKAGGATSIWGWIEPCECTTEKYLVDWYERQGFEVTYKNGKHYIKISLT